MISVFKEIDMAKIMGAITIKVRHERSTRVRLWLGTRLMLLAAKVMGCKADIALAEGGDVKIGNSYDVRAAVRSEVLSVINDARRRGLA